LGKPHVLDTDSDVAVPAIAAPVSSMSDLLAVVRRNADVVENIEEYVAREGGRPGDDPSAPRAAGG